MSIFTEFAKLNRQIKENQRRQNEEKLKKDLLSAQLTGQQNLNSLREKELELYDVKINALKNKHTDPKEGTYFKTIMDSIREILYDPNTDEATKQQIRPIYNMVLQNRPVEEIQNALNSKNIEGILENYHTKLKQQELTAKQKENEQSLKNKESQEQKSLLNDTYSNIKNVLNYLTNKGYMSVQTMTTFLKQANEAHNANSINSLKKMYDALINYTKQKEAELQSQPVQTNTGLIPQLLDDLSKTLNSNNALTYNEKQKEDAILQTLQKYAHSVSKFANVNPKEYEQLKDDLKRIYPKIAEKAIKDFEGSKTYIDFMNKYGKNPKKKLSESEMNEVTNKLQNSLKTFFEQAKNEIFSMPSNTSMSGPSNGATTNSTTYNRGVIQ